MTLSDVQTKLAAMGLYTGAIDGIDGPETAAAVKAFQTANQPLAVDGIAGPATKAALDQAVVT
jgi:peptidoglycan hydrolase-like protein with peptidoglycan-binding domain